MKIEEYIERFEAFDESVKSSKAGASYLDHGISLNGPGMYGIGGLERLVRDICERIIKLEKK